MNVLLVESSSSLRTAIADWLRKRGYEVSEASCGEAALEIAAAGTPPAVAVASLDFGDGRMTGFELGEVMRQRWPRLGLVYITGHIRERHSYPTDARERCLPEFFPLVKLLGSISEVAPHAQAPAGGEVGKRHKSRKLHSRSTLKPCGQ